MADLSIIEFLVYGFIGYVSVLMLIISTVKQVPTESSGSIVRAVYLIPGIIACLIIAGGSDTIILSDFTNAINQTSTASVDWTETISSTISLQNPIWVTFHYLLAMVLTVYVILQILTLFTKIK